MKKIIQIILILGIWLLSMGVVVVSANEDHQQEIEEGKLLVESKTSCEDLNDEQLEAIGEYSMEQMHPGEQHETMDSMMGGEGSESLREMHITMAKRLYCNEDTNGMMGSGGMMGMMNMMGGNMMGSSPSYYGYGYNGFWNIIVSLIFLVGTIALIIWLIYKFTKKGKESETPMTILQKRYAKGEINKKQLDEMKKELSK
ncbi:hypothetical protein HYW21_02430 [Candidatus Woesearchaeota archaeon]|nr:hypothetical protein [Candidatus Woesearchaeota archaeon]